MRGAQRMAACVGVLAAALGFGCDDDGANARPGLEPTAGATAADAGGDAEDLAASDAGDHEPPANCTAPLLFGHRGTILFAPENTLPAYAYAIDSGGDGIEVDLHVTADETLVAIHDGSLARTTDGGNVDVRDVTLDELSVLDAGAWFSAEFAGTRVPALDSVLDRFESGPALFLFDIKEEAAVDPLADAVLARDLAARSLVSSTSLTVLRQFHARLPDVDSLYYPSSLDDLDAIDVPSIKYVRVPKSIEDDPANVGIVRAAGYEAAISGRFVQWDTQDTEFTALGLVNNMELTVQRRRDRKPPECAEKAR